MRSLKNYRGKPRKNNEEHILPLINIVFLLLIFFMITGQLTKSDPFKINPSKSISSSQIKNSSFMIHMDKLGNLAFQSQVISKDELMEKLANTLKEKQNIKIHLKIDGQQKASDALMLLVEMRALGIKTVSLITELEPGS